MTNVLKRNNFRNNKCTKVKVNQEESPLMLEIELCWLSHDLHTKICKFLVVDES